MILPLALLASGFALWRIGRRLQFFLHIHQLEGYKRSGFLRWVGARPFDAWLRLSHLLGAVLLAVHWLGGLPVWALLLLWAACFASSRRYRRDRPKKPLAMTPRMTREAVTAGLLALLLPAVTLSLLQTGFWSAWLTGLLAADLLAPGLVLGGATLMAPVEAYIREGFKRQARRKLASRPDLRIVAITGSYGKTSVKFAVAEVLAQRYQVLATPGSFNTPMGICKVINNDLKPHHQVLVLEMGIRHPGDIAELCAIARPHVAVITGIGIAHLETMGSQDAIAREKGSLLDFLLPGGSAVLNADDPYYEAFASKTRHLAVSTGGTSADLVASEVDYGAEGTRFTVRADDEVVPVTMRLLGRHNVGNALLALAVGRQMGIRLRAGARALSRQDPVPHRLALREEGGLLVLDDAFNSNPVGARNAVEVLGAFAPRTRFVITPGMVELGDREYEENRAFGAAMHGHVDHAILVGPARTVAISEGLRDAGMPAERIHVVGTLFEARELLASLASSGDVVLYENDLPDQYTEA
ncbi:MAG: UDP-N-acetylmuramoyl-tripeptide--D-alanyl-D-alanine ligase [Rhodothermales bacterium]|nr:UDP-N-acetylmuramoyl-tripeptide--D-alanyl-D-alanine ligase [Rhodothermales bacterium]MBO6780605.1 UDP-N-acetylmuramoyl-tripeptide--D-alanyl-D-alanine ligase [Rhodothermales bacterium]